MREEVGKKDRPLYERKIYFNGDNLTEEIDCSLYPPCVMGMEAAQTEHYSAEKRKWQSAPCIATADGKQVFATFSGDNFGGDEQPNNYNVILCSLDGGLHWTTITVIDHPDSVRMHEPILWMGPDGMLWHFWAQSYNWWDGRGGVWVMKADPAALAERLRENLTCEILEASKEPADKPPEDIKELWSSPKRLCHGVLATTPVLLSGGEILLPVSIWKNITSKYHSMPELENSSVYVSTDGGESFVYRGGAYEKDTTFDENAVVELGDGSLYMIMRCKDAISYAISTDGGCTFSEPQKLMDHTSSRSWIGKLPSGHYVLVTNDHPKIRSNMTAFLSKDECKTWTPGLLLDERFHVSYPAGCVTKDGRVHVGFDFNRYIEEEVYYSCFTERDLENGQICEAGSFVKRLVSKGLNGKSVEKVFENGEEQNG